MSPLKRYRNPDNPRTFLKLSEKKARAMGLTDADALVEPTPSLVSSSTVAPPVTPAKASEPAPAMETPPDPEAPRRDPVSGESLPEGALPRGGVTAKARAATKKASSKDRPAPSSSPETPAPDAPSDEPEPKDKARPSPSRRRRKAV